MHYQNKIFVPLRPKNENGHLLYHCWKPGTERPRPENEKAQQPLK